MPRPTDKEVGSFGLAIYKQLKPLQYAEALFDWPLLKFAGAIGQIFQQSDTMARSGGPVAWSALLDIDKIPDEGLPWLGQWVGVDIDTTLTPAEQRQQIRNHENWGRGRPLALKRSVQRYLSGTRTVDLVERDTSPWHFLIVTYDNETPPDITYANTYADFANYGAIYTPFATYNDYWLTGGHAFIDQIIKLNKPGADMYTYTIAPGPPGTALIYLTVFTDYDTYGEIMDDLENYQMVYDYP